MEIGQLRALVSDDFEAVNALILEKIHSPILLIDDLSSHIIQSGGKRLRPLLVLLACHACGYQGQEHIKLAAMVEFFHTATLLHDDVVDDSTLRRGQDTANKIWGSKASILVGDYLFTQYMQLMIDVGDMEVMKLLTNIAHQIGCGEVLQLSKRHQWSLTFDEYFEIIRSKTSLLFAASSALGALISKSGDGTQKALYDYGLHVGNAFQLVDDALDYCSNSDTIGKNIGDDLADGKPTLPLLHVLQHGTHAQQELIKNSLKQGSLHHFAEIMDAIRETKAIEHTKTVAALEMDKAISSLQQLPNSKYKNALVELAQYAVHRQY